MSPRAKASPDERPIAKVPREEQLVAQAAKLFSSGGYQETALQDIADNLGITRPLFYYYFESKEDLLWRIIGHLGADLLEHARPIAGSAAVPGVKVYQIIEAHVTALLTSLDAFRIYLAQRSQRDGPRDRRLRRDESTYVDLLAEVIVTGQAQGQFRSGDAKLLARYLLGMANSTTQWYTESGRLNVSELSGLAASLACSALQPIAAPES
jgi:AcrR family transcriptional regulator